jgi:hypothetical protein
MPFLPAALATSLASSPLQQGEMVKFFRGNGETMAGCGVFHFYAQYKAERTNGETVVLYLSCPEMAPPVPKTGAVCAVTFSIGPIETALTEDPLDQPEGDQMIIETANCDPKLKSDWDKERAWHRRQF